MKNIKKFVSIALIAVMTLTVMSIGVFAAEHEENIQFVVTDENGNEIEVLDLVYLENVAEAYEQKKLQRWRTTTYYDLSSAPYTISGGTVIIVECGKHFRANSSGRLYYHGEVTDENAYLDIYDITNGTYKGSFLLRDQGDGIYSRTGYITGLGTSTSQYYSFGLGSAGLSNFTSYYAAISWTAL